jgi:hypothetical protein
VRADGAGGQRAHAIDGVRLIGRFFLHMCYPRASRAGAQGIRPC